MWAASHVDSLLPCLTRGGCRRACLPSSPLLLLWPVISHHQPDPVKGITVQTEFFKEGNIYFFIIIYYYYFWGGLRWVFIAACGLSPVATSGGYSLLRCIGFSLQWLLLLRSTGSRRPGFSSCGTWALLLRGMWDLPGPGIKPMFPALVGGFLTTAPPGESGNICFFLFYWSIVDIQYYISFRCTT